ncbi:MAG: DUF2383 domain-containing protein [Rubellimicrobium sp.]|nr:DUF2383 domain-containing protein [Rubellimicrobium sp.]
MTNNLILAGAPDAPGDQPGGEGDEIARLHQLLIRLVDTLDGFDKVLEKAEPEFVGVAEDFCGLHRGQIERVRRMLVDLGEDGGSDGSVLGTVNRAVVEMRSWFTEIGPNILDGIVDGEKRLIEDFDAVIAASPSVERRGSIDQMLGETVALLHRHAPGKL